MVVRILNWLLCVTAKGLLAVSGICFSGEGCCKSQWPHWSSGNWQNGGWLGLGGQVELDRLPGRDAEDVGHLKKFHQSDAAQVRVFEGDTAHIVGWFLRDEYFSQLSV